MRGEGFGAGGGTMVAWAHWGLQGGGGGGPYEDWPFLEGCGWLVEWQPTWWQMKHFFCFMCLAHCTRVSLTVSTSMVFLLEEGLVDKEKEGIYCFSACRSSILQC